MLLSFAKTVSGPSTVTSCALCIDPAFPVMFTVVPVRLDKEKEALAVIIASPVRDIMFVPPVIFMIGFVPVMNAVAPSFILNALVLSVVPLIVPNIEISVPEIYCINPSPVL